MPDNVVGLQEEVLNSLLELAKDVSRDRRGALIVVAPEGALPGTYDVHFPQVVSRESILKEGMREVLRKLAQIDGALILTPEGMLLAYGARIIPQATLTGFGTRHSAARGITKKIPEATAILVSEETGWIKVFQKGEIVLEADDAHVEPTMMRKMAEFLVGHDVAVLTTAGISVATLATMGLAPVSVLVIGGTYVIVRSAFSAMSSLMKK